MLILVPLSSPPGFYDAGWLRISLPLAEYLDHGVGHFGRDGGPNNQ
jgi:hypothetical protein